MTAKANAAIVYAPDAFEPGEKPMGRRVAGLGLLRGLVEHGEVEAFHGHGDREEDAAGFAQAIRQLGGTRPVKWSHLLDRTHLQAVGALHLPGPVGAIHAFRRRGAGQRAWSLTGVTHTISTHAAVEAIASMATAPVQSWDALVCTSRAARSVVEAILADQASYLAARLGAPAKPVPAQLPVIPLGVRCADFAPDAGARAAIRGRLGVDEDAVLVLSAARLSFHAKAHPHPMYLALQRAAIRTGGKVHLLLAGWFEDATQERVFREGARELCPAVAVHFVDGRDPEAWRQAWRGADVYTLLSDNIQETFGLSPVEAMAAGLPVVGSDWNGLRDTIVHSETGFLAPTLAPPPGAGGFMATAYDLGQMDFDQYLGATAQPLSVDVAAAADAFAGLIADADLRRRMGAAARARAEAEYDWKQVIAAYQALWAELAARRLADTETAPLARGQPADPVRADPYRIFRAYPTRPLAMTDRIEPGPDFIAAVSALADRGGTTPVRGVVLARPELLLLAEQVASAQGCTVEEAVRAQPFQPVPRTLRTITWLHKHGVISITPGPGAA